MVQKNEESAMEEYILMAQAKLYQVSDVVSFYIFGLTK